ncbi:hypothetical protein S83_029253, partial [Arachis hypogaea]
WKEFIQKLSSKCIPVGNSCYRLSVVPLSCLSLQRKWEGFQQNGDFISAITLNSRTSSLEILKMLDRLLS